MNVTTAQGTEPKNFVRNRFGRQTGYKYVENFDELSGTYIWQISGPEGRRGCRVRRFVISKESVSSKTTALLEGQPVAYHVISAV